MTAEPFTPDELAEWRRIVESGSAAGEMAGEDLRRMFATLDASQGYAEREASRLRALACAPRCGAGSRPTWQHDPRCRVRSSVVKNCPLCATTTSAHPHVDMRRCPICMESQAIGHNGRIVRHLVNDEWCNGEEQLPAKLGERYGSTDNICGGIGAKLEDGETAGVCMDSNGNRVGEWNIR